jgi:hypothetical protein
VPPEQAASVDQAPLSGTLAAANGAIELAPNDAFVRGLAALAAWMACRPDQVRIERRRAIALNPKDPQNLAPLGTLMAASGIREEGLSIAAKGIFLTAPGGGCSQNAAASAVNRQRFGRGSRHGGLAHAVHFGAHQPAISSTFLRRLCCLSGKRQRCQDRQRRRHEAEALPNVVDSRFRTEGGRGGRRAVLEEDAVVAVEIRLLKRAEHALIHVDARKQKRDDAQIAQDAVECSVAKAGHAVFCDVDVFGLGTQFIDDLRRPAAMFQYMRA